MARIGLALTAVAQKALGQTDTAHTEPRQNAVAHIPAAQGPVPPIAVSDDHHPLLSRGLLVT